MKRIPVYFLLMLIMCISLGSCEEGTAHVVPFPAIEGNWELRKMYHGIGGQSVFPAGNGNRYTFTGSSYKRYEDGILAKEGSYTIAKGYSSLQRRTFNRIIFDAASNTPEPVAVRIEVVNEQLVISADVIDGPSTVYAKVD